MHNVQPQTRHNRHIQKYRTKFVETKQIDDRATNITAADERKSSQGGHFGGFDSTPLPYAPPGYTLKFVFHRAVNLPFADFSTLTSDSFVIAQLLVHVPKRHMQDPNLSFRTHTVRRNTNPEWNSEWIVANVPESGFELKCFVYDEDSADHDDRLGIAFVKAALIGDGWKGIQKQSYPIKKRYANKRVYIFRRMASVAHPSRDSHAHLIVSVDCLGKTPGDEGAHMYTVGPNWWFRHFSPLIGRIAGTKASVKSHDGKREINRYKYALLVSGTLCRGDDLLANEYLRLVSRP
jgi:hypothetical protein